MPSSGDTSSSESATVGTTDLGELIQQRYETIQNSNLSEKDKKKQFEKLLKFKKSANETFG